MLKYLCGFIIIGIQFFNLSVRAEMKSLSWFKNKNCTEINIVKYKSSSDSKVIASVSIKEKSAIKTIMDKIQSLPTDGDLMRKMGPDAKKTTLLFSFPEKESEKIDIYDQKIKTPSTGFLSSNAEAETELLQSIDSLLAPDLNVRLPKIEGHPFKFKGFSVAYTGSIHIPQAEGGPTIGPVTQNHFAIIEDGSANQVTLTIYDGQIPPQPQAFAVGKKVYYLLTYQGRSKQSLYPNFFEISEKLP